MNFTTCSPTVPRMIPVTACLLIGIAMFTLSGCADQNQQAEGLVRAAIKHSEAGRHSDAVQLAGRAIALNPGLAEAFYLRGSCLSEMHQSQKAVEDLSAATRLKPNWDEAWCALGIAQMTSGATELGVASLTKALQLNSKMQPAWEARARGYRDLHRTDYELLDLEELLQLDPAHCEALLRHGTLLSETNQSQAIEDFSHVIRRDRNNATAWMQRGLCYNHTGDTDRALADLNIACRLRPNDFHSWLERGRILRTLERFDDAISDLSKAAELAPHDFSTRLELGRAYFGSSNFDAASANLLEAERLSPHDGDLRLALAQTDIAQGRKPAALERLRSLLADEKSLSSSLTAATRIHLAELLLESNETDESMSHVDEVLAAEPAHSDALRIHAALLAKSNRREEAIEDYTRLISSGAALKPNAMAKSFLDRGRLQLEGEDWSAASEDLSKYLEVYPDDIDALTLRARAFLAQDETGKAITDLTSAIFKKPNAELYTLRAEAFDQFHEPAAALADLQKVASLQPGVASSHQKLAERLFQDRQFGKAARTLDALAASSAGLLSAEQRLLRGRARLADGDLNGAHEDACALAAEESALPGSVKPEDILLLQSMIALQRHDDVADWQAASDAADVVLRSIPDDPRALQMKGNSLFQHDRFLEALETLDHPALLSRDTIDSRWMRIQCCDRLKLTYRELEELNALLGDEPTHEDARLLRSKLLENLGHFDDAVADLSAVLQQNPANLSATTDRALLNQRSGNAVAAVVDFTKAIELSPVDAELYYRRGIARHQVGQSDDARQDLDKAIELNPQLAEAWYVIGNIEAGRGQTETAAAAYAKAVEIKPEYAAAWYNRGNLLFNQSKLHQAVDCWTIAISIQPELFRAYNNRAAAYDLMDQDTAAVDDYEKTLLLNPGFVRAWDNLAWLLATSDNKKVRDPERAVKLATQACELSEFKDWTCLNTLATCCAENQEFDAALKWARQARSLAPEADRKELDQLVAAYEARLKSKRITGKSGGRVR